MCCFTGYIVLRDALCLRGRRDSRERHSTAKRGLRVGIASACFLSRPKHCVSFTLVKRSPRANSRQRVGESFGCCRANRSCEKRSFENRREPMQFAPSLLLKRYHEKVRLAIIALWMIHDGHEIVS